MAHDKKYLICENLCLEEGVTKEEYDSDLESLRQQVNGKQAALTAGTNITISGTTISAKDTTYGAATTSVNGLMSSGDKTKLDGVATGAQVNKIESVKVNGTALTVSDKAVDIDLSGYATKSEVDAKQDDIAAGTGISIASDGVTINHSNSVSAQTTYVGSSTAIPRIKYDAQGHVTGSTTVTVYPPTTVGNAGQVWVSDGSGTGAWKTLVTISTSDPSGGSDGDLWFKYE